VQAYLDAHGPALRTAAASLGEEVRRQTLDELYKWRAQLSAQLTQRATAQDGPADRPLRTGPTPVLPSSTSSRRVCPVE
jgi:hypothetical protein